MNQFKSAKMSSFLICVCLFFLPGCKEEEDQDPAFGSWLLPLKTSLVEDSVVLYTAGGLQSTNFTGDLDLSFFNSVVDVVVQEPRYWFPDRIEVHRDSAKFFYEQGVVWYEFERQDSMATFSTSEPILKAHIPNREDCHFFEGSYGIVLRNKSEDVFYSGRLLGIPDLDQAFDTLGSDSLFVVPLEFYYEQWEPD